MVFRPYPVLTLAVLAALAVLIWLGLWQLDRRAWKQALLADYAATADASPADLETALCGGAAAPGLPAASMETFAPGEVRLQGVDSDNAPGWRIFRPVRLPRCAGADVLLAETAFEPLLGGSRSALEFSLRYERPRASGPFTPEPNVSAGEFYAFDRSGMAQALGVAAEALSADWVLAADDGTPPAHLTQTPPARHLGYAVTWFLTALALIGVYLAFHRRAGRLRL